MKIFIAFSILLAVISSKAQDAIYVDSYGLLVTGNDGKIDHRFDKEKWKISKDGSTETFTSIREKWQKDRTIDTIVHVVKDGSSAIAISKRVTTLTEPQYKGSKGIDYKITDAKTYLKECSDSSEGNNSKCDIVSAEMCGKLYGETMKLQSSEMNKCVDLMAKVNEYHDEAIRKFDVTSTNSLASKFPEIKSLKTAKSGDYAGIRSLYVFGSLCRELRCRQGVPNCLSEDYFPTVDRKVPSAKPITEVSPQ